MKRPLRMIKLDHTFLQLTRVRKIVVLVGTLKALAMAVKNQDTSQRQTYLKELLQQVG